MNGAALYKAERTKQDTYTYRWLVKVAFIVLSVYFYVYHTY